jgi:hypothetical protein
MLSGSTSTSSIAAITAISRRSPGPPEPHPGAVARQQDPLPLPDGPAQEARDAEWARAGDRSPDALRWLYDHDPAALEPAVGMAEAAAR